MRHPSSSSFAGIVGAPPGPDLLDQVKGAAGNPLFVLELVWALLDHGQLEIADGCVEVRSSSLPPSFVQSVLRRLSFLTQPTLEALQVASVLGADFFSQRPLGGSGSARHRSDGGGG